MKFLRKHKKAVIICGALLVVLLTAIILMFTLFKLKKVDVNLKTETLNLTQEDLEEIKEETLSKSGSVLFYGKDKLIKDLESKFPYLKIVNIETKIPDQFVIHCAEREEFLKIESNNKTFVLDEELKILRIDETNGESSCVKLKFKDHFLNEETGKYEEKFVDLNLGEANVGQFLKLGNEEITNLAKNILFSFEENNRNIGIVKGAYSVFEISMVSEEIEGKLVWTPCLKVFDKFGFETQILKANENLSEKLGVMFEAISSTDSENLVGKTLIIYKNLEGKFAYSLI